MHPRGCNRKNIQNVENSTKQNLQLNKLQGNKSNGKRTADEKLSELPNQTAMYKLYLNLNTKLRCYFCDNL